MDTSIAIAIALGVLFLVSLPGYLRTLEAGRARQTLDRIPESVRMVEVHEPAPTIRESRSTTALIKRSPVLAPAVDAPGGLLPSPRWPMAIGSIETVSASRERPRLRVVGDDRTAEQSEEATQAEVQYLDLASGELYPASHISTTPEERLMQQDRPPQAVASASRRPAGSPTRRPLAHLDSGSSSRSTTRSAAARTSRNTSAPVGAAPASGTGRSSADPRGSKPAAPARTAATPPRQATPAAPARYPLLGMLFLLLAAATVAGLVLMAVGAVSWAVPLLASGLAVADLALISALRRGGSSEERTRPESEQTSARREVVAEYSGTRETSAARAAESRRKTSGSRPGQRQSAASPGASAASTSAARKAAAGRSSTPHTASAATASEPSAPEAAASESTDDAARVIQPSPAETMSSKSPYERRAAAASEPRPAGTTADVAADAVDPAARRAAVVKGNSWTPTPVPEPTYARGGADVSLQEALAMEFVAEAGRRPEIDDQMAHGRNATRPGKADAAGMAEAAREKRAAAEREKPVKNNLGSIDDILQRRRA